AGRLLDEALEAAGIDRRQVYVTNVVKHFKWEPHGKRRIHQKPNSVEITACRPWLEAEVAVIRPHVIVCLGATAAQAVLGKPLKVTKRRGEFVERGLGRAAAGPVPPSAVLRAPDDASRHAETARLIADLRKVAERLR